MPTQAWAWHPVPVLWLCFRIVGEEDFVAAGDEDAFAGEVADRIGFAGGFDSGFYDTTGVLMFEIFYPRF